jgi:twitching motility protein PilT
MWEIRSAIEMEKTLELAWTWHTVYATLHTSNAISTIDRILNFFPIEKQKLIIEKIASSLKGIFVQALVERKWGWKVLIKENLIQTDDVMNAIRNYDMKLLQELIVNGEKYWMITMDKSIEKLYKNDIIDDKTAVSYALQKWYMKRLTNYDEFK